MFATINYSASIDNVKKQIIKKDWEITNTNLKPSLKRCNSSPVILEPSKRARLSSTPSPPNSPHFVHNGVQPQPIAVFQQVHKLVDEEPIQHIYVEHLDADIEDNNKTYSSFEESDDRNEEDEWIDMDDFDEESVDEKDEEENEGVDL